MIKDENALANAFDNHDEKYEGYSMSSLDEFDTPNEGPINANIINKDNHSYNFQFKKKFNA